MFNKIILGVLVVVIIGTVGFLGYKRLNSSQSSINRQEIGNQIEVKGWKTYTNTKYKYQVNYSSTAEIIIPNLEDRQLIENGKSNIENLKDIQFREETPYSFWFVASISGNEKNLSPEQFVDAWIEMGKKNPGNSFDYTDRSNISLSTGKTSHLTIYKWYASGINQNVLVKTLFYPLKGNILILSFSSYNTDSKTETETIENKINQIINSLKETN